MSIKAFKRVNTTNPEINRLQESVNNVFKQILDQQILSSNIITNIRLTSSSTTSIDTKLSEPIKGWIIIRKDTNSSIWENRGLTNNRTLALECDADVIIDLLVF